jgi:hypothetical protein
MRETIQDVFPVARLKDFRAFNFSRLESFGLLKLSKLKTFGGIIAPDWRILKPDWSTLGS